MTEYKTKSYIILPKNEWNRISRRKKVVKTSDDSREEYFNKLFELSQSWQKRWPDTVQGHVEQAVKNEKYKRTENVAFFKTFLKKEKPNKSADAMKKAKQMIFEDSCYGRQLLSALIESKTLEERILQIDFQKKLKEQAELQEKNIPKESGLYFGKSDDPGEKQNKQQFEKDLAEINRTMHEMKIAEVKTQKANREQEERENAILTRDLLRAEALQEKAYEAMHYVNKKEYDKERKECLKHEQEKEKQDEMKVEKQRAELENRRCKIELVMKQVHQNRRNTESTKKHYDLIKKLNDDEKKSFDDFVEAGISGLTNCYSKQEHDESEILKAKRDACRELAQVNMDIAEEQKRCSLEVTRKCVCDRQCILNKSKGLNGIKTDGQKGYQGGNIRSFERQPKSLLEKYKLRKKELSPWTGLTAAHAHFAHQASSTLAECTHKIFARKVVDEYRKINGMDSTTLPVNNYY